MTRCAGARDEIKVRVGTLSDSGSREVVEPGARTLRPRLAWRRSSPASTEAPPARRGRTVRAGPAKRGRGGARCLPRTLVLVTRRASNSPSAHHFCARWEGGVGVLDEGRRGIGEASLRVHGDVPLGRIVDTIFPGVMLGTGGRRHVLVRGRVRRSYAESGDARRARETRDNARQRPSGRGAAQAQARCLEGVHKISHNLKSDLSGGADQMNGRTDIRRRQCVGVGVGGSVRAGFASERDGGASRSGG